MSTFRRCIWYQHHVLKPRDFHFLAAIMTSDLQRLKGFDIDFSYNRCYDDNEFIYRIKHILQLQIVRISYDEHLIYGVHQFHDKVMLNVNPAEYNQSVLRNNLLLKHKIK